MILHPTGLRCQQPVSYTHLDVYKRQLSDGHRDDDRYMCNSADGTFYDKENVVSTWKNIDGVKVCGMFEIDWAQSSPADIVSYDADSNRVKVNATINGYSGRYYYSNVVEEIDTVGEYYIDKENGVLYFYAPENYLDIKISVPNIGKLISDVYKRQMLLRADFIVTMEEAGER